MRSCRAWVPKNFTQTMPGLVAVPVLGLEALLASPGLDQGAIYAEVLTREQTKSAVADASHTGYFFFTSSVEGVGVLAMSGSDYSRPNIAMVPEPGEWAMLLAGLALVAGLVRRRG